jgi:hypothetical protein
VLNRSVDAKPAFGDVHYVALFGDHPPGLALPSIFEYDDVADDIIFIQPVEHGQVAIFYHGKHVRLFASVQSVEKGENQYKDYCDHRDLYYQILEFTPERDFP